MIARHFDADELAEIAAFWKSPVGRKMNATAEQIREDMHAHFIERSEAALQAVARQLASKAEARRRRDAPPEQRLNEPPPQPSTASPLRAAFRTAPATGAAAREANHCDNTPLHRFRFRCRMSSLPPSSTPPEGDDSAPVSLPAATPRPSPPAARPRRRRPVAATAGAEAAARCRAAPHDAAEPEPPEPNAAEPRQQPAARRASRKRTAARN